jgi:hypothetical protein
MYCSLWQMKMLYCQKVGMTFSVSNAVAKKKDSVKEFHSNIQYLIT